MTTDASPSAPPPTMCARHPDVETGLACGRCGTPICPKCLVYTPAGTRCPTCATIGRPKMYVLGPLDYAKAVGTAVVVGLVLGVPAALVFGPSGRLGIFSLLLGGAVGYGVGIALGEALNLVTGRKRGREMQMIATGGVLLVALTRFIASGVPVELLLRDFGGIALVLVAISVASTRLR